MNQEAISALDSADPSTLADSLRRSIRLAIVRGRLAPGAPLRTQSLREEYGCSLTPLREALSWLAADGLVTTESQRGFRVAHVTRAEWQDIIARRLEIEPRALQLAIKQGKDQWEGHIVRCAHEYTLVSRRMLRTTEIDEVWEEHHRELHLSLVGGCRSPWLMRFCASLYDHSDRYRRLSRPASSTMGNLQLGESELVSATLARNSKLADRLLREHINEIGDEVLANDAIWEQSDLTSPRPRRRRTGAAA